jgi:hypothetical protein
LATKPFVTCVGEPCRVRTVTFCPAELSSGKACAERIGRANGADDSDPAGQATPLVVPVVPEV